MKHKKKHETQDKMLYKNVVHLWKAIPNSPSDPDGMYTGRPKNPAEQPQQDQDDL